jgi:hypothetical protein
MVVQSKRSGPVLTIACSLLLACTVVQPNAAAAIDSKGPQYAAGHVCGHRFEPGPIVNGHYRQPTPAEFEARMRQLQALYRESAGFCSLLSLYGKAGDVALGLDP